MAKKIVDRVEGSMEDLFLELSRDYNLEFGDISPHQTVRLKKLYKEMSNLMQEWVMQNRPRKIGKVI